MTDWIRASDFHLREGLEDWRVLSDGALAAYRTRSFAAATALTAAIGELAGVGERPPDIDVRGSVVSVRLVTRSEDGFGMSMADVDLGRRIAELARAHGATPDIAGLQSTLLVIGTRMTDAIRPFWQAVLGYEPRPDSPDEDLVDPRDRGTAVWFEAVDDPDGAPMHVGVWVAPEVAEARLAAALAAGGVLVRDRSPMWWTLADAEGHECDVGTILGRD